MPIGWTGDHQLIHARRLWLWHMVKSPSPRQEKESWIRPHCGGILSLYLRGERGSSQVVCSNVAIPASEVPEVIVPASQRWVQLVGDGHDAWAIDDRDDHLVSAHQVVEVYEQRRTLDRIELALRGSEGAVVVCVLPSRDISALPLVLLAGNFPRRELVHEQLGIGLRHARRVHLEVAVEVRLGIGIRDIV